MGCWRRWKGFAGLGTWVVSMWAQSSSHWHNGGRIGPLSPYYLLALNAFWSQGVTHTWFHPPLSPTPRLGAKVWKVVFALFSFSLSKWAPSLPPPHLSAGRICLCLLFRALCLLDYLIIIQKKREENICKRGDFRNIKGNRMNKDLSLFIKTATFWITNRVLFSYYSNIRNTLKTALLEEVP